MTEDDPRLAEIERKGRRVTVRLRPWLGVSIGTVIAFALVGALIYQKLKDPGFMLDFSKSSTLTVSGIVTDLSYPSKPLIQAGAGCGYLYINITSSTALVTDGTALAVGDYLESVGTGSCQTSATAKTLYVAANAASLRKLIASANPGASPTPTSVPSGKSSASPAPTPTLGAGLTSQACLSTRNGQWPTTCRPYLATAPYNIALPDSPKQTSAFPAGLVSGGNIAFSTVQVANNARCSGIYRSILDVAGGAAAVRRDEHNGRAWDRLG